MILLSCIHYCTAAHKGVKAHIYHESTVMTTHLLHTLEFIITPLLLNR